MEPEFVRVTVNEQGRIVIPAAYRSALGIRPGDSLVLTVADGRLIGETQDRVIANMQALFAHIADDRSLVDELLADRRKQAAAELEPSPIAAEAS